MKMLFIRLDKIGDLIATLPIDQLPELKEHSIHWVIAEGLAPLVQTATPERSFSELSLKEPKLSFKKLREILREQKPEALVSFYGPWWIGLAALLEGVKIRVGRKSQWHSYLFFNRAIRQSRSLAEKHEADYNRELVQQGLQLKSSLSDVAFSDGKTPVLELNPPSPRHLFEKWNIRSQEYFVVHPGMAGSALNWPQAHYNILIEKLVNAGTVVITGTPSDAPFLNEIKPQWENHPNARWMVNSLNMKELLGLLKAAKGVVAPSTGVLHMAASCGTKCVGIYSPVTTHHERRWGPRGPHAKAITPRVDCPASLKCLGPACSYYNCMDSIKVNQVLKELEL